jgi:hypothetical protein
MANGSDVRRSIDEDADQAKKAGHRHATKNAREVGQKVPTFTQRNISAALQFPHACWRRNESEVVKLQTEYMNMQSQDMITRGEGAG